MIKSHEISQDLVVNVIHNVSLCTFLMTYLMTLTTFINDINDQIFLGRNMIA